MTVAQAEFVTIGRIERPFGVKGAVKVRSLSDVPGRFDRLGDVTLVNAAGQTSERRVTHVRRVGSGYIVQFAGMISPEDAGLLRGCVMQIPRESLPTMSGVYFECDLIGMTVVDEAGQEIGSVETMWELPGHHVFVVKRDGREVLIPAAKAFVTSVDLDHRRMVVHGIEGLLEESHAL